MREIADVLRRNIVQARKVEEPASAEGNELWGAPFLQIVRAYVLIASRVEHY